MEEFTVEELAQYDGRDGAPAYVAYEGRVYDVSGSFLWQGGKHQVLHHAGEDHSGRMGEAPHGPDLLERVPVVGRLRGGARG